MCDQSARTGLREFSAEQLYFRVQMVHSCTREDYAYSYTTSRCVKCLLQAILWQKKRLNICLHHRKYDNLFHVVKKGINCRRKCLFRHLDLADPPHWEGITVSQWHCCTACPTDGCMVAYRGLRKWLLLYEEWDISCFANGVGSLDNMHRRHTALT